MSTRSTWAGRPRTDLTGSSQMGRRRRRPAGSLRPPRRGLAAGRSAAGHRMFAGCLASSGQARQAMRASRARLDRGRPLSRESATAGAGWRNQRGGSAGAGRSATRRSAPPRRPRPFHGPRVLRPGVTVELGGCQPSRGVLAAVGTSFPECLGWDLSEKLEECTARLGLPVEHASTPRQRRRSPSHHPRLTRSGSQQLASVI